MTGPQDQGKLHEDRAAEGVSRTRACLPRLTWGCSLRGLPSRGSISALVDTRTLLHVTDSDRHI